MKSKIDLLEELKSEFEKCDNYKGIEIEVENLKSLVVDIFGENSRYTKKCRTIPRSDVEGTVLALSGILNLGEKPKDRDYLKGRAEFDRTRLEDNKRYLCNLIDEIINNEL